MPYLRASLEKKDSLNSVGNISLGPEHFSVIFQLVPAVRVLVVQQVKMADLEYVIIS